MGDHEQIHSELLSLMEEAKSVCIMLQNYSEEKLNAFSDEDDLKIVDAIKKRELIINKLIDLEYRIDLILDENEEYAYGNSLPPEIEEIRQSIRKVLNVITDIDLKAMQLVSSKMQKYKDETLKARNKKNLSAYIKNSFGVSPPSNYDYKK